LRRTIGSSDLARCHQQKRDFFAPVLIGSAWAAYDNGKIYATVTEDEIKRIRTKIGSAQSRPDLRRRRAATPKSPYDGIADPR
jgi:hypothetical protein